MAAKKKKVKKKKLFSPKSKHARDTEVYAEVMVAIMTGLLKAVRIYEKRKPNGDIELEIEEEEEVDE